MLPFARTMEHALNVSGMTSPVTGNGGGVSISVPGDPQPSAYCPSPPVSNFTYWSCKHSSFIYVTNSTLNNNTASSPSSSGGGLYLASGGLLSVSGSSVSRNTAGLFGGGLGLGSGDRSDTCALQLLSGTTLAGNTAGHGGAQVYMGCSADMLLDQFSMALTLSGTQVTVKSHFWSPLGCPQVPKQC
jgi:fibronectin-binding autotransporter adhesin